MPQREALSWEQRFGRASSGTALRRSRWYVPITDMNTYSFIATRTDTVTVDLAQTVDATGWRSGVLMTRVFGAPVGTGSLTVFVVNSFVGADEPTTLFGPATPTSTFVAQSTAITSATTTPQLDVIQLNAAPIGPQLRVFLAYTDPAGGSRGVFTLGIALLGRRR